ncbi:MAG: CpsD/CapB family tyrosine-protein kinase [Planctomycetota bacterium]
MIGLDEKTQQAQEYRIVLDLPHDVREYYTLLRDRLMLSYKGNTQLLRTIAVTSCHSDEGVSTVALNLAVTIAHHEKVLLIDADPEDTSVLSSLRDIPIHNPEAVEAQMTPLINVATNLDVLSVALMDGDDPKQFESPVKLEKLLNSYRADYDCIVVDTPPMQEGSAALRISSLVDGVVIVVEAERTRIEAVKRTKEQLKQVHANVLGIVLNKRRLAIPKTFFWK